VYKIAVLLTIICSVSCATTELINQQNQAVRHPVCEYSEHYAHNAQDKLDNEGFVAQTDVRYCGPLTSSDDDFGVALVEVALFIPGTGFEHLFLILKFVHHDGVWQLVAKPEAIIDFVQTNRQSSPEIGLKS